MTDLNLIVVDYGFTLCSAYFMRESPPGCPAWTRVVEEEVFGSGSRWFDPWMAGAISARDVATFLAQRLALPLLLVEDTMRRGCQGLPPNARVVQFVRDQRALGRKTALVTGNIDLFSTVVVPDQGLADIFDVIVNSADYHETRKERLWPIAFQQLGAGYGYTRSFLLEDSLDNVLRFADRGGRAYCYTDDAALSRWLARAQWLGS